MNTKIIQNKLLLALIDEFEKNYALTKGEESKSFERLVNYVALSKFDPEAFSDPAIFDLIDVDSNGTFGIDSFALFVNDNLIADKEDIDNQRKSKRLDVKFVFIQTKRSTSIDSGDFLKFTAAVRNLFSDNPSIPLSEELENAKSLISEIFKPENARLFANKKPKCELFFATAGNEIKDDTLNGVFEHEKQTLQNSIPEVYVQPIKHISADFIIDAYNEIENRYSVIIDFPKSLPCEVIDDVEQAYIGYLNAKEFLKLIQSSDGSIRRNIFYENVRDFQGLENSVNGEIQETLEDISMVDKFILLNNGVTIVARNFSNLKLTEYEVSDYYVVNGCQTSNMIYNCKELINNNPKLQIPVKIIHTNSNDLIAKLIRSTNRQTPVPDEAFVSLEKFHKRLQEFYKVYGATTGEPLYYERRSKEFSNTDTVIERPRIINLHAQIRSFVACMLNEPQTVMSRNPSSILNENKARIFLSDHKYAAYYLTSALIFTYHQLQQNRKIKSKLAAARYWVCWIARILAFKKIDTGGLNSQKTEQKCEEIIKLLCDPEKANNLFQQAISIFEQAKSSHITRHGEIPLHELVRLKALREEVRPILQRMNSY